MNSGYEPSRKEVIGDMFSKRRLNKLYTNTIEFGKGFGTGLWYVLQFPYNVPTQVRKNKERNSLLMRGLEKRSNLDSRYDKWDEIIEEHVDDSLKIGNPLKKSNGSYRNGMNAGLGFGLGIDFIEALAYIGIAASAMDNPKSLPLCAPIVLLNAGSGLYELYRKNYKESRQKLIDDIDEYPGQIS